MESLSFFGVSLEIPLYFLTYDAVGSLSGCLDRIILLVPPFNILWDNAKEKGTEGKVYLHRLNLKDAALGQQTEQDANLARSFASSLLFCKSLN